MPTRGSLVRNVRQRDADTPGFHDIDIVMPSLRRRLQGEPALAAVMRSLGMDVEEAISGHVPGAFLDPATGDLDINAGYDPDSPAGRLEVMIWHLVRQEVAKSLARKAA